MAIPKTPKNSTQTSRIPKTPKHTNAKQKVTKGRKRPHEDEDLLVKKKKVNWVPENITVTTSAPQAQQDKASTKSRQPKQPKKPRKSKKPTQATDEHQLDEPDEPNEPDEPDEPDEPTKTSHKEPVTFSTEIEDLDPKNFLAQHTRAREIGKIALRAFSACSKDGLVDISDISSVPSQILCDERISSERSDSIISRIVKQTPIEKMRFSKKAVHFTQFLAEKIFKEKLRDIYNMSLIGNKQTITLEMVWAERNYRANCNLGAEMRLAHTLPNLSLTMIEDTLLSSGDRIPSDYFGQKEWDTFESIHKRINTCENTPTPREVAQAAYGSPGPWNQTQD